MAIRKKFDGARGSHYWHEQMRESITSPGDLAACLPVDRDAVATVARTYPLRVPRPFLQLIRSPKAYFWRQALPDQAEWAPDSGSPDPTEEEGPSPVDHRVHRDPDRVVLLVSNRCALYCRFCMRKRRVDRPHGNFVVSNPTGHRRHRHIRPRAGSYSYRRGSLVAHRRAVG